MADEVERRSNRRRNAVCYQHALSLGSDDDDFADPPPSKKPRPEKTTSKRKDDKTAKSTTRLSRDEKLYNRAIEQALQKSQPADKNLSDKPSSPSEYVAPSNNVLSSSSEENYSEGDSEDSDFCSIPSVKTVSRKKDDIKRKSISTVQNKSKQPQNATSAKPTVETILPQSSTTPKDGVTPTEPLTPGHQHSDPKNTSAIKPVYVPTKLSKPISTMNLSTPKDELSVPVASKTPPGKFPKWTPPSKATKGGISDVKSSSSMPSGSPVMRLGLSRNAKITPLHKHKS